MSLKTVLHDQSVGDDCPTIPFAELNRKAHYIRRKLLLVMIAFMGIVICFQMSSHVVRSQNNLVTIDMSMSEVAFLPVIFNPMRTPELFSIANADQDNYYTVSWEHTGATMYILEESGDPSFSTSWQVYAGSATDWYVPSPGKLPDTYYYRVKSVSDMGMETEWSNVESVTIYPLFVGLELRWDGEGYIRTNNYYVVGYHHTRDFVGMTEANTIHAHNVAWYDPNPPGFDSTIYESYYSVSTGYWLASSIPADPAWKVGFYSIVPYDIEFHNGQTFIMDDVRYSVSGPHQGHTAFGQEVWFWRLVNMDNVLYWDNGGDWVQYVHSGDLQLHYDAGRTRLLLHRDIDRTYYYRGEPTNYYAHYIINLTASNSFPQQGQAVGPNQQSLGVSASGGEDFGDSWSAVTMPSK